MTPASSRTFYLRRLAIGLGAICISGLPLLAWHIDSALISHWFWLVTLQDLHVLPRFEASPALLAVLTLLILVAASWRRTSWVLVTGWFALNAVSCWICFATFRLQPAG